MEEAPESYKDVTEVVNTCEYIAFAESETLLTTGNPACETGHAAGISNKVVKLRPIGVVKG